MADNTICTEEDDISLLASIVSAHSRNPIEARTEVARDIRTMLKCSHCALWRINRATNTLHLSAYSQEESYSGIFTLLLDSPAGEMIYPKDRYIYLECDESNDRLENIGVIQSNIPCHMYVFKTTPAELETEYLICVIVNHPLTDSILRKTIKVTDVVEVILDHSLSKCENLIKENVCLCITKKSDRRSFIYKVSEIILDSFRIGKFSIYLWDSLNEVFKLYSVGDDENIRHGYGEKYDGSYLDRIKNGESYIVHDSNQLQSVGYTQIVVPLVSPKYDGNVLGFIHVTDKKNDIDEGSPEYFSDKDIRIYEYISMLIAVGIHNFSVQDKMQSTFREFGHETAEALEGIDAIYERLRNPKNFGGKNSEQNEMYLYDLHSYTTILKRLHIQYSTEWADVYTLQTSDKKFSFITDVLMPSVRAARMEAKRYPIYNKSSLRNPIHFKLESFKRMPNLYGDPIRLQQIMSNILSNACKYNSRESDFEVFIDVKEFDTVWTIVVADKGFGIRKEIRESIFKKDFRSAEAKRTTVFGHGLGLYIARKYIQLHEGEIYLLDSSKYHEFDIDNRFSTVMAIDLPKALALRKPRSGI